MKWLERFATRQVKAQVERLLTDMRKKDSVIAVLEAERDALAAVIARDRQRVQAEAAGFARQRAVEEGVTSERNHEGASGR